jgi:predicted nucleic acid-binding protein
MELLRRRVVEVAFHLEDHVEAVARLLRKYANVPMALADGCLVHMAELSADRTILTLDRDFRLYRKSGRHVVPVIMPDES